MEALSWDHLEGGGTQRSAPGTGLGPGPQLLQQGAGAEVQSQTVLTAGLRGGRAQRVCVGRGRLGVAIVWSEDGEGQGSGVRRGPVGSGAGILGTCVGVRRVGEVCWAAACREWHVGRGCVWGGVGHRRTRCAGQCRAACQQPLRATRSVVATGLRCSSVGCRHPSHASPFSSLDAGLLVADGWRLLISDAVNRITIALKLRPPFLAYPLSPRRPCGPAGGHPRGQAGGARQHRPKTRDGLGRVRRTCRGGWRVAGGVLARLRGRATSGDLPRVVSLSAAASVCRFPGKEHQRLHLAKILTHSRHAARPCPSPCATATR